MSNSNGSQSAVVVDTSVYHNAATSLTTLRTQLQSAVDNILAPGLSKTGGMAGGCAAAAGWATAYDELSSNIQTAIIFYGDALLNFGGVLAAAGYNWDMAEYNGVDPKHRKGPPPVKPDPNAGASSYILDLPQTPGSASGTSPGIVLLAPTLSNLVTTAPDGRTDLLGDAVTAWNSFINNEAVSMAPVTLQQLSDSFGSVQAPEVPDITEALGALQNGITDIFSAASQLGTAVQSYHDDLVDLRTKLASAASTAFPKAHNITTAIGDGAVDVSVGSTLSASDVGNAATAFDSTFNASALASVLSNPDFATYTFDSLPKLKALSQLPILPESGNPADNKTLDGELDKLAAWDSPASTLTADDLAVLGSTDPHLKAWIAAAVKYGDAAGIDPRLVMAIVLNEGATRTLAGAGEIYDDFRWLTSGLRNNSLGLTNMKEATFNRVKAAFPAQFQGQSWSDLDGNEDLAIKATAYDLRNLQNEYENRIPASMRLQVTPTQFLAAAYNVGEDNPSYNVNTLINEGKLADHGVAGYANRAQDHYNLANQWMVNSGAYSASN
ncbi:hypothetical protein KO481_31295 [Nocardia sp. NEAU-G5]|uniref:Transglycosylase SLT domain-containing protein n=1 Tax=Nocardia albiluteola TaxID=2842303 RepID=A0ABS6B9C4_9NOCA|nr:hypothetical protein [Nocardia albiluteola]MBU3065995.1 hypothetical protein [Nocardia albiluteola]